MQRTIDVTEKRRKLQEEFNAANGITPETVKSAIQESMHLYKEKDNKALEIMDEGSDYDLAEVIRILESEMFDASENLEFERAALIRDQIRQLKAEQGDQPGGKGKKSRKVKY